MPAIVLISVSYRAAVVVTTRIVMEHFSSQYCSSHHWSVSIMRIETKVLMKVKSKSTIALQMCIMIHQLIWIILSNFLVLTHQCTSSPTFGLDRLMKTTLHSLRATYLLSETSHLEVDIRIFSYHLVYVNQQPDKQRIILHVSYSLVTFFGVKCNSSRMIFNNHNAFSIWKWQPLMITAISYYLCSWQRN